MKKVLTFIILGAVLLSLIAAYIIITGITADMEEKDTTADTSAQAVDFLGADSASVSAVSFSHNGTGLSFTRSDGVWSWDGNGKITLSDSAADSLINTVLAIKGAYTIASPTASDLESYGLSNPEYTVSFTDTKNSGTTVNIGKYNSAKAMYYVCLASDTSVVYLTDKSVMDIFGKTIFDFMQYESLPNPDKSVLKGASFTSGETVRELTYYNNGSDADYTSMYNWYISENGGQLLPLDETVASNLTTELTKLSFSGCVSLDSADFGKYGLDAPFVMTVTYLENGEVTTAKINIGKKNEDDNYYASPDGSDFTYILSGSVLESLLEAPLEPLLTSRIVYPAWSRVDKLEIKIPGTDAVSIGFDYADADKTAYTVNGVSVEYSEVEPALTAISAQKADKNALTDGITQTAPSSDARLELTFTLNKGDAQTLVVSFFDWSDGYVYAEDAAGRTSLLITEENLSLLIKALSGISAVDGTTSGA